MNVANLLPRWIDGEIVVCAWNWIDAEEFSTLRDHTDLNAEPDYLRRMLREYGAWSEEELQDHEENLRRLYWIIEGHFEDQSRLAELYGEEDDPDWFYFSIV